MTMINQQYDQLRNSPLDRENIDSFEDCIEFANENILPEYVAAGVVTYAIWEFGFSLFILRLFVRNLI